ncbi:MAG TPA: hypothetical protein VF644_15410, partial [Pyrinomonadaceae bacterium]
KAQTVFDTVAETGVKAVLNFAPVPLQPHPEVKLKTVDLTISLEGLSYFLSQPNGEKSSKKTAKKTSK